eukprot:2380492-Rhodomonas_salina.2
MGIFPGNFAESGVCFVECIDSLALALNVVDDAVDSFLFVLFSDVLSEGMWDCLLEMHERVVHESMEV